MLPMILFNVISSLVIDLTKHADDAQGSISDIVDDLIPASAKKELDKFIKDDPTHQFTNAKDALVGAVEGKLPIIKADGTLKPIEISFTIVYDPKTGSVDMKKKNGIGV